MSDPQIALLEYVQHKPDCAMELAQTGRPQHCDCGLAAALEALLLRSQGVIRQECSPEENERIDAAIDRDAGILNTGFDIGFQMGREETTAKTGEEAYRALQTILRGFDEGVFVRNVGGDDDPAWALKVLPYIHALAQAQHVLAASDGERQA